MHACIAWRLRGVIVVCTYAAWRGCGDSSVEWKRESKEEAHKAKSKRVMACGKSSETLLSRRLVVMTGVKSRGKHP